MRLRRRLGLSLLAVLVIVLVVGRVVATQRLATPLPRDPSSLRQTRLDAAQMQLDLQILASDRFQGRAPGTAGNDLAVQMVESRFRELGLTPFGESFEEPFTFTQRSVRPVLQGGRPFEKTFTDVKNVVGVVRGRAT